MYFFHIQLEKYFKSLPLKALNNSLRYDSLSAIILSHKTRSARFNLYEYIYLISLFNKNNVFFKQSVQLVGTF